MAESTKFSFPVEEFSSSGVKRCDSISRVWWEWHSQEAFQRKPCFSGIWYGP